MALEYGSKYTSERLDLTLSSAEEFIVPGRTRGFGLPITKTEQRLRERENYRPWRRRGFMPEAPTLAQTRLGETALIEMLEKVGVLEEATLGDKVLSVFPPESFTPWTTGKTF